PWSLTSAAGGDAEPGIRTLAERDRRAPARPSLAKRLNRTATSSTSWIGCRLDPLPGLDPKDCQMSITFSQPTCDWPIDPEVTALTHERIDEDIRQFRSLLDNNVPEARIQEFLA